jgi:hypothetical protein
MTFSTPIINNNLAYTVLSNRIDHMHLSITYVYTVTMKYKTVHQLVAHEHDREHE